MASILPTQALLVWVERQLGVQPAGYRFPSNEQLSRRFGLSVKTVQRVLAPMAREGKIIRLVGKGTFSPHRNRNDMPPPGACGDSAGNVRDSIARSIQQGILRQGRIIPSVKYLACQYHVSRSTVTAALRQLLKSGHLTRAGRRYLVGKRDLWAVREERKRAVIFLCHGAELEQMNADIGYASAMMKFETEMAERGYRIEWRSLKQFTEFCAAFTAGETLPYALIFFPIGIPEYLELEEELAGFISRCGEAKPEVLMVGEHIQPSIGGIQVLCVGNLVSQVCRRVAQFIFERRFTRAYYYFDGNDDPVARLSRPLRIMGELSRLTDSIPFVTLVRPADSGGIDSLESLKQTFPERFRSMTEKFEGFAFTSFEQSLRIIRSPAEALRSIKLPALLISRFDTHAVDVLNRARDNRIRVPEELSIVTLENKVENRTVGVSACVFDWDAMGYTMAQALLHDVSLEKSGRGFLKVRAIMLERGSTP